MQELLGINDVRVTIKRCTSNIIQDEQRTVISIVDLDLFVWSVKCEGWFTDIQVYITEHEDGRIDTRMVGTPAQQRMWGRFDQTMLTNQILPMLLKATMDRGFSSYEMHSAL